LATCQYKYASPTIEFSCNEPTITNSKFCIFHDEGHYAEHPQEAIKRFDEKLGESISQNKPLECFGYYLPEINFAKLLEGKSFAQPIYFDGATIYGRADFSGATFSKEVDFGDATFSKEVDFDHATFSERASFFGATFSERADFGYARFSKEAIFFLATFSEEVVFGRATFSKEVDFGDATFSERASFFGLTFPERAGFQGTTFSKEANFEEATFSERADFGYARFSERADFSEAKFLAETSFLHSHFEAITLFRNTLFEQQNKVTFGYSDLSKVSFADSDITRIRFGDKITWGGRDMFTIIEEEWLTRKMKRQRLAEDKDASLELVLSVYRNLRENYEFRLRYDDAGKFFTKEMELKRKYRPISSKYELKLVTLHRKLKRDKNTLPEVGEFIENGWFMKHFSLTGLYYHLSKYGESISRPTLIGAITILLSTLFWVTQSNPTLEPNSTTSTFVGFENAVNGTQWLKAFERSFADFLPLLSLGGDIKVGIIDYIIKIVGGALTFGLLIIAFRRKFERKYTR
jgi:uncharacterized protein YjbI with pentapeptide repeats